METATCGSLWRDKMERKVYTVSRIEGEYAYLTEEGSSGGDELFIAMALLPLGTDEGCRLIYENFEFLPE